MEEGPTCLGRTAVTMGILQNRTDAIIPALTSRITVPDPVELLKAGNTAAWNTWRNDHPNMSPVLRFPELNSADLRGANLSGMTFDRLVSVLRTWQGSI